MKTITVICIVLATASSATAKTPNALNASEARVAAYTAAQGYFGDLFDSKARLGQGQRLSSNSFVFPGRVGREGGYVNCTFKLYVRLNGDRYTLRARGLRCA